MKRKFSFDVPKLKFGPSKQETQALKEHLDACTNNFVDSEPPTPKSVRPPLPPITEAELKAACTWVVANYRPSHIPHQEAEGVGISVQPAQHVDYAAINAQVRREREGEAPVAVQWPIIPSNDVRVEQNGSQWPSSEMFRYKPTETSKDLFHHDEFDALREQRQAVLDKADQLMANLEETQKVLLSPEIRSHSRAASNQSTLSLPARDAHQRPKADPRSDSVGTINSTPRTDITGSARAGSTAPTSPYVTPAHQSKRTSQHVHSDTHLPPKVTAVDAEWMRQELERHLKSQQQDEGSPRQESTVQDSVTGLAETTPTQVVHTPASPRSVQRKPLPRRQTGESLQNFSLPTDSRPSRPHSRPESRYEKVPMSPRSTHVPEIPTKPDPIKRMPKRESSTKAGAQDRRDLARPSTAQTAIKSESEMDRPRSRAHSMRSQVVNFSRPSLDAASRKTSLDISRPVSRDRSVDSFRSAVSAISDSFESTRRPWRSSRATQRSENSDRSAGLNSARASDSHRGRPRMPRSSPPPPPKPKVNLNRELPPLPGLDQWKPVEAERSSTEQADVQDDQADSGYFEGPTSERTFPRRQDSLVNRRPATAARHQPSASSPALPTAPTRQSVYLDAETTLSHDQPLAPTNTRDPAVTSAPGFRSHERYPRSKSVMDAASPVASMGQLSLGQVSTEQRPQTRQLNSATQTTAEKRRSYNPASSGDPIAPNFSRKISSSDDYHRMYDLRYQNMLEVTPSRSNGSGEDRGHENGAAGEVGSGKSKGKGKKHWWQGRGRSRVKREENWMDAVIKSGSKSGVLLTDEVAGAPIVRY